nr:PREDICTED: putative F-box protein At1g32420 [Daucus carota subsp. sativus]
MPPIRPNPTLSDDLITEILARVPVKSLLRFKSVSKTWLSLINHPAFLKSQLLHTLETNQTLILSRFKRYEENRFLLLDTDSRTALVDLNFPYSRDEFSYVPTSSLVGSANGIVCVAVDFVDLTTRLYLWNPATRHSKVIPTFRDVRNDALGFGYDPVDRDYKVVRVGAPPSFAEVYSCNTNVWSKVSDPVDVPRNADFDVCVNGFLCGVGEHGMMVFDLNKEVLNCAIKLPVIYGDDNDENDDDAYGYDAGGDNDENNDDVYDVAEDEDDDDEEPGVIEFYDPRVIESNDVRIIEFNKSIAVIIVWDYGLNDDKKINLWTLDDDACLRGGGVEASWPLMFSIDLGMPLDFIHGYSSNGDIVIILDDAYVWISCNVDKKEAKILPLSTGMAKHLYTRHVYKYTESLVLIAGFEQVNWNAPESR